MPTADFHFNQGNVHTAQGQLTEAIHCYRQALGLNPRHDGAWHNLGSALVLQGESGEAVGCFRQALQINPSAADTHHMLGNALFWQGELENAIASYRQVLRIAPKFADAHIDLGSALLWQGQHAEAESCFRRALEIEPGNGKALWHRAWLRLLQGDFLNGWPDYERRPALTGPAARSLGKPRWDGAPLQGKIILIHAEQGLGDTIQFARYLPMVQRRGGTVLFECQPSLETLFTGFPGVDRLIPAGSQLPVFDVVLPLLCLPLIFGTTLATIPAQNPYLYANSERVEYWRQVHGRSATVAVGSPLNIGIAWQGSMDQKTQKGDRRCLPLAHFAALAGLPGVRLYSLQVGPGTQQIASVPFPIFDLGSRFNPHSLSDLAAALVNMDLVVTVDSAVAHLAGALGVPVWTLLAFAADWRWLLDRSDSPWYPSMRLFRQRQRDDWDDVLHRIVADLPTFSPGSQIRSG